MALRSRQRESCFSQRLAHHGHNGTQMFARGKLGDDAAIFRVRTNWEATTVERTSRPFATTAAAVSSQEVSIPRMVFCKSLAISL